MKQHLARVLRRLANRIDPPPKATFIPVQTYTTTAGTTNIADFKWRATP